MPTPEQFNESRLERLERERVAAAAAAAIAAAEAGSKIPEVNIEVEKQQPAPTVDPFDQNNWIPSGLFEPSGVEESQGRGRDLRPVPEIDPVTPLRGRATGSSGEPMMPKGDVGPIDPDVDTDIAQSLPAAGSVLPKRKLTATLAPTAPKGVTERSLTAPIKPDPSGDTRGSLGPMIMAEGSNDVRQTEEEDRINEKRIMDEFVLQNTEWEDRNNPLKIREQLSMAIRYYDTSLKNPLYVGDPGNFMNLSKFSRPAVVEKKNRGRTAGAGRGYMANPGQKEREGQYSNVFKPNEVTSGLHGAFGFHSIYSNMNDPSLPDHTFVF